MPLVEKFQCDNPECDSEALPEDGGTKKKPLTPYHWFRADVLCQGRWAVAVTVCSTDCLLPAVQDAEQEVLRIERGY